jgi:hypothetical protein
VADKVVTTAAAASTAATLASAASNAGRPGAVAVSGATPTPTDPAGSDTVGPIGKTNEPAGKIQAGKLGLTSVGFGQPDATKDDTPKADTVAADATKTDPAKTDVTKTDAPKADAPKADAPKADATKTDASKTDASKTDASKTDASKTDASKTDLSKADVTKTDVTPSEVGETDAGKKRRKKDRAKTDPTQAKIGAPDEASEPKRGKTPRGSRFVGAGTVAGALDAAAATTATADGKGKDPDDTPKKPVRNRRVSARVVILLVVLLVAIGAAGGWYYKRHQTAAAPTKPPPTAAQAQADVALAARIGIQHTDLPGWTTTPGSNGDVFASIASGSSAALAAQKSAEATLARCLKVSTPVVTRAFGGTAPARTAQSATPTYSDPGGAGFGASSVVDVMRAAAPVHGDFKVFSDPSAFASCYQPYVQTMLPYATATAAAAPFSSVTVQPATVPTLANKRVKVLAVQVIRTNGSTSVVTMAVAMFGGTVQANLAMTSPSGFPTSTEASLVQAMEQRVAANLPKKS